jgi:hypothetical protein
LQKIKEKKMDKEILSQYDDLRRELLDTKSRIRQTSEELHRMDSIKDTVRDTVKGGEGGIHHYTVEGFPYPEYERKKTLLFSRQMRLARLEERLDHMLNEVEEYIDSVGSSRKRLILKYRYIDVLSWREIAKKLGPGNNEDTVRIEISRFLEKDGK